MSRETADLARHEVHDVVGHAGGRDAFHPERPSSVLAVQREVPVLLQRPQKLNDEERIAVRLLPDQVCERVDILRLAMQCVTEKQHQVGQGQRSDRDARHVSARPFKALDGRGQQMFSVDLTVAVRADDQEMVDIGSREEPLEYVQRRRIDPLEIVQEHDERMLLSGQGADEALKDVPEPIASLGGIEWRRR